MAVYLSHNICIKRLTMRMHLRRPKGDLTVAQLTILQLCLSLLSVFTPHLHLATFFNLSLFLDFTVLKARHDKDDQSQCGRGIIVKQWSPPRRLPLTETGRSGRTHRAPPATRRDIRSHEHTRSHHRGQPEKADTTWTIATVIS